MTASALPGWTPSESRTIEIPLDGFSSRGLVAARATPIWPSKCSADNLDFCLDLRRWLKDSDDRLMPFEVTILTASGSADDLRVGWQTIIDDCIVLFLGGGQPGSLQTIQMSLVTSSGRHRTIVVNLPISLGSPPMPAAAVPTITSGVPIPPNAILLPDGNILVDESGIPYLLA